MRSRSVPRAYYALTHTIGNKEYKRIEKKQLEYNMLIFRTY